MTPVERLRAQDVIRLNSEYLKRVAADAIHRAQESTDAAKEAVATSVDLQQTRFAQRPSRTESKIASASDAARSS
jgi:hypothetical protein